MGGDLNLKKSWHPVLMSNQRRVWEEEKKALDERKRTEQRIKELKEERAKEEIQQKLEAAGSRKRVDRVDWMYQGPSSGQTGTTEEMEGYLLGKRRIDGLIKGTEHKKLEKQAAEDSFMALQHANTLRDTAAKVREDPMLAIKKQEQAAYEAMMNDPIKRRQLLAAIEGGDEKKIKKDRKHRHHHRHRRSEDSGDERSHKRRRTGDEDRERSIRRSGHRRYSDSRTPDSRSVSPDPRKGDRNRRRRDSRSASPRRRRDDKFEGDDRRNRSYDRRRRSPSYSSDSRTPSPNRRKSYPAGPDMDRKSNNTWKRSDDRRDNRASDRRPLPRKDGYGDNRVREIKRDSPVDREAERQRKLESMQQDASALDVDRERRLAALAEKEKADREAEDKARAKSSKYGDKGDFVNGLHRKAGDMSLGDRLGRGRQAYQKDD